MAPHSKKILVAPIYISHLINTFDKGNCINTGRLFVGDITSLDINNWRNSSAAKYYNLHSNSIALTPDVIFSESLPSTISNPKTPFDVTVYDHKIYYINTSKSCDSASKADFFVKVYPKHWYSNKLYYLDEFFDLQTRKAQMKKLYLVNKNIAFMLDSKAWFGLRDWHEIKSNSNNFDFTWESAYRATVLTNDFKPVANVCAIVVYLPDYAIDHIETGQIKNGSQLWKVIIHPKP